MKTNDPYFQAFDKVIGYDSKTLSPKKKFPISKTESLTMALMPVLVTYAGYTSENALILLLAAFLWAFFAYVHVTVYINECRKAYIDECRKWVK